LFTKREKEQALGKKRESQKRKTPSVTRKEWEKSKNIKKSVEENAEKKGRGGRKEEKAATGEKCKANGEKGSEKKSDEKSFRGVSWNFFKGS